MGATALSTGLGIAGQAQHTQAQQVMYGYQGKVARKNQIMAGRLATDVTERGRTEEIPAAAAPRRPWAHRPRS